MEEIIGLTTSGAARRLGISEQTVKRWAREGKLNPVRNSVGWRYFDPKEVKRLAKRLRRELR